MKVIELTYTYPAETFIQRHVLALRTAGVDVRLVARAGIDERHAGASIGAHQPDMPAVVMPNFDHLDMPGKLWSIRHLLFRPQVLGTRRPLRDKVLLAFFEQLKPDLIHFHMASLAAMMCWIPQELGIPYTVSLRGSDVQVMPLRSKEAAQEIGRALREAAGVHAISRHLVNYANRWAGSDVSVQLVYNPIPLPPTLPPYRSPSDQNLHLITVGRLHWTKGYPDLLQALAGMANRGLEPHLVFVGSGPDESRLRYWVERFGLMSHVTFLGKVPWRRASALLLKANAYVHSSMAEGFGNAIAEAMAWGCPVFITDACGARELITDDESGFLLPALHPETWPETLALAQDRVRMERVRQAAFETAHQCFDPQRHAESFIDFYEQALRHGAQPISPAPVVNSDEEHPHSQGPVLLVRGAWQWENGPDLVLRALAPLCRDGRLQMVFAGQGPQEDELRYLADFLGLAGQVRLIEDGPSEEEDEAQMVLDIAGAQEQGWRLVQNGAPTARLAFGEVERLRAIVEESPK